MLLLRALKALLICIAIANAMLEIGPKKRFIRIVFPWFIPILANEPNIVHPEN